MTAQESSRVFLSYSGAKDLPQAEAIAQSLSEAGIDVWLDKWDLVPGARWFSAVEQAMSSSRAVLLLVGPSGLGNAQKDELRAALYRQSKDERVRVIPMVLPGADLEQIPPSLRQTLVVDLRKGWPESKAELQRLAASLQVNPTEPQLAQELELAAVLHRSGDTAGAEETYGRALRIAQASFGPHHPLVAEVLRGTAQVAYDSGRLSEALTSLQQALTIESEVGSTNSSGLPATLNQLAIVKFTMGDFDGALAALHEALAIAETQGDSSQSATYLSNLGQILREQGRLDESLALFERALAIEETLGNHASASNQYNSIAGIRADMGDLHGALALFERSLAVSRQLGDTSSVARRLNNIGSIYLVQRRMDQAIACFEQAAAIHAQNANELELATVYGNLGSAYRQAGQPARALELYERVYALESRILGDAHPRLAMTLNNVANALFDLGEHRRAVERLEAALRLVEASLGPENPTTKQIRENLRSAQTSANSERSPGSAASDA